MPEISNKGAQMKVELRNVLRRCTNIQLRALAMHGGNTLFRLVDDEWARREQLEADGVKISPAFKPVGE